MNERTSLVSGWVILAGLLTWSAALAPRRTQASASPQQQQLLRGLPLAFEENRGQMSPQTDFTARGLDYGLSLNPRGAQLTTRGDCSGCGDTPPTISAGLELVGANPKAEGVGERPLAAKAHYFVGRDPRKWVRNVPNFGRVRYRGVYPGVDIVYYGTGRKLEYDLVVQPGARPDPIRLRFPKASGAKVSPEGDLLLTVQGKELRQQVPLCFQEKDGRQQRVEGRYVVTTGRSAPEVRFALGAYDRSRPLVIDPVLEFSTMLGSSGQDFGHDIALDPQGNVWITGSTLPYPQNAPSDFPTLNPRQGYAGDRDAIVLKLTPQGTLLHSSYLGGLKLDEGQSISVDGSGNPTVVGYTSSTDFPLANPAQGAYGGGFYDGFVTRLSADGSQLRYSTYLGGDQLDEFASVEVDAAGNSTVAGTTESLNLATPGVFQHEFAGRSLFRSSNGGASWTGITAGLPSSEIRVLAIAPSAPEIMYAGTQEHGIYRSSDGGSTWSEANGNLPSTPPVLALAVDPTNPNRVFVSFQYLAVPSNNPGQQNTYIYQTTNGGQTWVSEGTSFRAEDFVFDPTSPGNMLAAEFRFTTGGGVRRRVGSQNEWFLVALSDVGVSDLAQEPVNNRFIYAATYQGLRKSTDFGLNFGSVLLPGEIRRVEVAPSAASTVYALGRNSSGDFLSRSTDGGTTWTTNALSFFGVEALAVDPLNANTVYLTYQYNTNETNSSAVVLKSTDGGQNFTPIVNGFGGDSTRALAFRTSGQNTILFAGADPAADALVARFDPAGNRTFTTYLGGLNHDEGNGVSLAGNRPAVTGATFSADFPLQNARQTTLAGQIDAFVTRLSADALSLEVSTYLGGSGNDFGLTLDTDAAGNFLLGGDTRSTDFPGTSTGFQTAYGGGRSDSYVAYLTASGASLPYATYLGGSDVDGMETVRFGPGGHAFVFGDTPSTDFPTRDAFQTTRLTSRFRTTFLARINPAVTGNNSLIYSTYLGGTLADVAGGMVVDATGEVFLTGYTWGQFPLVQARQVCYAGPNFDFFAGDIFFSRVGEGPAAPIAPRTIRATAASESVVNLTWVDRTNSETGYRVLRKEGAATANTQYVELAILPANAQSYQDTLAVPNTTYSYVLIAFNAQGGSDTCPVSATTPVGTTPAPDAPSNLAATVVSGTQINLTWQDNSNNETGFQIQRKEGINGPYGPIQTTAAGVTSYQDKTVTPGKQYFYQVRAQGLGGFSGFSNEVSATTPQVADTTPPQITNVTVDPRQLASAGGAVTISADVVDAAGSVASVVAVIQGTTTETVTLQLTTGTRYSGTFNAPANLGAQARSYTVQIRATDNSDNLGTASGGTITVTAPAPDTTAPQVNNIQVTPRTLPSTGGPVEIRADVTDAGGVATVVARIQPPTGGVQSVTLTLQSGSTYVGTYNAPANTSNSNRVYGITLRATDANGNQANTDAGAVTVSPPSVDNTPPQISNVQVTPRILPSAGGAVEIRADVTDAGGIASVVARIQPPSGAVQTVTLSLQSGSTYVGSYNAPANSSGANRVYGVTVRATDSSGNQSNADAGTVTVSPPSTDTTPPQVSNIQVTPTLLSSAGGAVEIRADVTDGGGVGSVVARIQPLTGAIQTVTLTLQSGSTYAGTFTAPVNNTAADRTYSVTVRATDTAGNQQDLAGPNLTVQAPVPSGDEEIEVTPSTLKFGDVKKGGSATRRLRVRNLGAGPVVVTLTGAKQPFTATWLGGDLLPASKRNQAQSSAALGPGETREVKVTFKPGAIKSYQARLQFSIAGGASVVTVLVSGRGCRTNPTE